MKGVDNAPADFLSRTECSIDYEINDTSEFFERNVYLANLHVDDRDEMRQRQVDDPLTSSAIRQLEASGKIVHGQFRNQLGMVLRDGLLCRGRKIVVVKTHHRYFLLLVDIFSKYVELYPMPDQESSTIIRGIVDDWIHRHGPPDYMISDQGPNVDGIEVRRTLEKYGIVKNRSSP